MVSIVRITVNLRDISLGNKKFFEIIIKMYRTNKPKMSPNNFIF